MFVERLNLTPGPVVSTFTVAEFIRIGDAPDLEPEIALLTEAAQVELENAAGLAFLSQTIRVSLICDGPVPEMLRLPVAPMPDDAAVTVTLDDAPVEPLKIFRGLRPALLLPPLDPAPGAILTVTYGAGFGPTPGAVPADLRAAVCDHVAAIFDTRGAADRKGVLSPHALRILARYRRVAI